MYEGSIWIAKLFRKKEPEEKKEEEEETASPPEGDPSNPKEG
jgi:hypothetical protein